MPPIDALYLDTNVLFSENWLSPSAALTQLLDLAKRLGIPVLLPELVIAETCGVFRRDAERDFAKIRDLYHTSIEARLSKGTSPTLSLPTVKSLSEKYDSQATAKVKELGLVTIPMPTLSLQDAILQSAAYKPPFRDTDIGFRDSIIAMSCAEHAKKNGFKNAIFIANDEPFKLAASEFLGNHKIRIVAKAKDASDSLTEQLQEGIRKKYEERQDEVLNALRTRLPEISRYLTQNLHVSDGLFGLLERVVRIEDVRALDVDSVIVTGVEPEPIGEAEVSGGADVSILVTAQTQGLFGNGATWEGSNSKTAGAVATLDFTVKRVAGKLVFAISKAELGPREEAIFRNFSKSKLQDGLPTDPYAT